MVDYVLTDGKGTAIRQSDSLEEGYVDVDLAEVADVYSSLEDADVLLIQRGATDPRTVTVAVIKANIQSGLQDALADADWLNNGYLY